MKKLILSITLMLALAGGATLCQAQSAAEKKAKAQEANLKKYDANKNGKLDPEEEAQMKKDREEILKKYDKNGDGKLDDSEKEAMKADAAKKNKKNKNK